MNKRLFNTISTCIFFVFLALFLFLYIFLVFIPYGYTDLTVTVFCVCVNILFLFFVISAVFMVKAYIEYKRFLDDNEYNFGEKITFHNYDIFSKQVERLMNSNKEQYMISFSPVKISVNYEIYQTNEIKKLNRAIVNNLITKFNDKEYKKMKVRYCYDNYCFLIYFRGNKKDVYKIIEDIENKTFELAKEEDLRIFIQTYFGVYNIQDRNTQVNEATNRANVARRIAEYNYDKIVFFDTNMVNGKVDENLANQIIEGLKNKEFVVYYQPKYNLNSKTFIGSEALIRWNSKEHGLVSPIRFINFAENKGLIHELDLYVLDRVCQDLIDEQKRGRRVLPVSVNFSIYEFYCPTFLTDIKSTIEKYNVNPSLVEIEITEGTTHANSFLVTSILKKLKDYGMKILLDDFGLGFSNIGSLKTLPVDVIKIDKSFIDEIVFDYRSRQIVETIVKLAKAMSFQVIAEGVGDVKQVEMLKKLKCDSIQGFYYSQPIPLKEYEKFLANNKFEKKEAK